MHPLAELKENGFCVISGAFEQTVVDTMRSIVTANLDRMANTRPNPASRHLAGFHRFDAFEPLHQKMISNKTLHAVLTAIYAPENFDTIGLSDITVNRSQGWHTDLLRGKYAQFLTPELCWGAMGGICVKALLYLQNGRSLQVLLGSHLIPASLADDRACGPGPGETALAVEARVGDVILMDIRLKHRGSTEQQTRAAIPTESPKILVSTVFGSRSSPLARAMQLGNSRRMKDWDTRHISPNNVNETPQPVFDFELSQR